MKILLIVPALVVLSGALNCQADPVSAGPSERPSAAMSTMPSLEQRAAPAPAASPKKKPLQKKKVEIKSKVSKSSAAKGKKSNLPPILLQVQTAYAKAGTLFAEFTQTKESVGMGTTTTSSGRIAIKRPNKIRWETLSPDPNLLVSDGVKAWYYTPPFDSSEHGQVTETLASRVRTRLANAILSGDFSGSDLKIKTIKPNFFSIVPKAGTAANVKEAKVAVDPSQKTITDITIIYDDGNHTEIKLTNIKLGAKLGDDVFVFQAPPNTDHVKE
jgi:outer membrane lipoprotein carrier protein